MTDSERAALIYRLTDELTEVIDAAMTAGLTVDVTVTSIQKVTGNVPTLTAMVSRPL